MKKMHLSTTNQKLINCTLKIKLIDGHSQINSQANLYQATKRVEIILSVCLFHSQNSLLSTPKGLFVYTTIFHPASWAVVLNLQEDACWVYCFGG